MKARKDTRHISYNSHYFDKTRKYSNHRKQPIPSYDIKKRFKTTSHTTHFLTRPGNTPITLQPIFLKQQEKIQDHSSCNSHFNKTRKYSNHRLQPMSSYDNKIRYNKTTAHTTHILTRPGNDIITLEACQ